MSKIYIHNKISNKNIIKIYFISIIPLILYGIYKNGFMLYQKSLITPIYILKPILFLLIPFIITILKNIITKKYQKIDYEVFYWTCIGLFIPYNFNLLIYTALILILNILMIITKEKIDLKPFCIILILIIRILTNISYLNPLEEMNVYSYNIFDLLFGKSIGGVFATSTVLATLTLIIMIFTKYYKKEIPIISMITFSCLSLSKLLFHIPFTTIYENYAGIFLAFILIGSQNKYTPYLPKLRIVYAIALGIITFLLTKVSVYEGTFIAIFILNIIMSLVSNIYNNNSRQKTPLQNK